MGDTEGEGDSELAREAVPVAQGPALPVDSREGVTAAVEDTETVEVWEAVGEGVVCGETLRRQRRWGR